MSREGVQKLGGKPNWAPVTLEDSVQGSNQHGKCCQHPWLFSNANVTG